jgi:hypothetical protein
VSEEEVRIARTEALFRNVNERIAESAARFLVDNTEFVCECSDQSCTERVEATLDEYEDVRSEPTHFLLRPGHEDTRVERVVERRGTRHAVVQKFNDLIVQSVRRLDPRTSQA